MGISSGKRDEMWTKNVDMWIKQGLDVGNFVDNVDK